MENALARQDANEASLPMGVHEEALRLALEEARQLAAQSRLLALNAALESAGACGEAEAVREMEVLGGAAGQAIDEAEKIAAAVELLLQQIRSASALPGPL